ncbi:DedA family protein [Microbacterium sp. W4I4]|uniref:DedA family protein n=1 Tax=Microbacterium sp. W4I4 TaxID=3042295 RepID=UPI0027D907C0|nr:DedA family protein [Microbacterium sp. W4I4]
MDIINDLIMQAVASPWLYLVLFAVAVIDGFFPPVPSETVLIAAAAVAASGGDVDVILLGVVGGLGAVLGDNIAYRLGRAVGTERFAWMRRPRVIAAFDASARALERGGAGLILGARYVPVGRVAVNMTAGAVHYPWRRFLPLSVISGFTWAAYSIVIGMIAGNWLKGSPFLSVVIGIAIALAIGIVIDRVIAWRRRTREARETPATDAEAARLDATVAG